MSLLRRYAFRFGGVGASKFAEATEANPRVNMSAKAARTFPVLNTMPTYASSMHKVRQLFKLSINNIHSFQNYN